MKKKIILLVVIMALMVMPAFVTANAFESIFDVINDGAELLMGKQRSTKESLKDLPQDELWKPVLLTMALVGGLVSAGLANIKLFDKKKGAVTTIAIIMAIATVSSPITGVIWSMNWILIGGMLICVLVFLVLSVVRSSKASSERAKVDLTKMKSDQASAEKDLKYAEKDRAIAESELRNEEKMIDNETQSMNYAMNSIDMLSSLGKDELRDLEAILDIVKQLSYVSDERDAAKLKESALRALSAAASAITHKRESIAKLEKEMKNIQGYEHEGLGMEVDLSKIETKLIELYKRNVGTAPGAATNKMKTLKAFAQRTYEFFRERDTLIKELAAEIDSFDKRDQQANQHVQNIISRLHENNFPSALTEINNAITLKKQTVTATQRFKAFSDRIDALAAELNKLFKATGAEIEAVVNK